MQMILPSHATLELLHLRSSQLEIAVDTTIKPCSNTLTSTNLVTNTQKLASLAYILFHYENAVQ